ncbi:MAG: PadR family transcriptional regulator [Candidatus Omnitrophica bacterium]|nr:PadR family transcriptional regulator [Candidatus Omnitrophota bacterium]MDD5661635.1 PadR family transcriptional regulator [Candidatus Omnitrophota bacterium]
MIEQELLLLGLLREGPKHGYDIKSKIKQILSLFAGVDLKSIYYPLRILKERGLVVKKTVKPGKRPERIVYALTPKGQARFEELLSKSLLNLKRPQFSLDLSLYFLRYMKPAIACRRLQARLHMLNKISRGLEKMAQIPSKDKTISLSRILEHNLKLLKAESRFLDGLIQTMR